MIVVDANVAVKWYVLEDFSEIARALFGRQAGEIVVPELFRAEVIGALIRKANIDKRQREATEEAVAGFLKLFADGHIRWTESDNASVARASKLALDLGHPLKDCLYLELAMRLDAPLFTFDLKFAEKARTVWPRIEILV